MLTVSPCSTPVSTRTAQRQIPHKQKKKGVGNLNKLYKAIAMLQAGKEKDWLFSTAKVWAETSFTLFK